MSRSIALIACLALCLGLALTIAACGGGSSSTGGGGSETGSSEKGGGSADVAKAEAEVAKFLKGDYGKPEPHAAKPKPGENVWEIYTGPAEASLIEAKAFEEAAKEVGWNPTTRSGKFEPNAQLAAVREAVQAHASAIWIEAIDCAPIKAGLIEAKQAGIPVVASNSKDCEPALFTAETEFTEGGQAEYGHVWGTAQAAWAIAHNNGEAKIVQTVLEGYVITEEMNKGAKERLASCEGCELSVVPVSGAELGAKAQQKVEQELLKKPETNVVNALADSLAEAGVLAATHGKNVEVMSGEGTANGMEEIRNGEVAMSVALPLGWVGWSAVDGMIRLLGGEKEIGNSGAGLIIVDAEHNLPPKGQAFSPEAIVPYKNLYRKIWGIPTK